MLPCGDALLVLGEPRRSALELRLCCLPLLASGRCLQLNSRRSVSEAILQQRVIWLVLVFRTTGL